MKKTAFILLLSLAALAVKAQLAVKTINEDFNTSCAVSTSVPAGWIRFNPITGTVPDGQWHCNNSTGRDGSGGVECTNYWSGAFHMDTAYLISPKLNFHDYTDSIYIRFDSKTTKVHLGGKMSIVATTDSFYQSYLDISTAMTPLFTAGDSSDWVTHSINMSAYESFGDFYVAFMFTGTDTSGSTWFLDNIYTTTSPLNVHNVKPGKFSISASGSVGAGQITVAYDVMSFDTYMLDVYDVVGRHVAKQSFIPKNYTDKITMAGLDLAPGLYIVRMANGNASRVTRIYVD